MTSSVSNAAVVGANQGRALLQVTWIPSAPGGNTGFHHTIKFRVNDAYPLQALVVGRLCVPPSERLGRFKVDYLTLALCTDDYVSSSLGRFLFSYK